jgi:hypothetical protein
MGGGQAASQDELKKKLDMMKARMQQFKNK